MNSVLFLLAVATVGAMATIWTPTTAYHQVDPETGMCLDCDHDTTRGQR